MEVSVEVADKAVSTDDQNFISPLQFTDGPQQSFESGDSSGGINVISSTNTTEADGVNFIQSSISATNQYFQMARLESVLATLLENKFTAIRKSIAANKKNKSISPRKRVANKLQRILSSSTASSSQAGRDGRGSANYDSDQPFSKSKRKDWKHQRRSHHHSGHHHHHDHHRQHKRKKFTDSENEFEVSPNHRRHKRRRRGRKTNCLKRISLKPQVIDDLR